MSEVMMEAATEEQEENCLKFAAAVIVILILALSTEIFFSCHRAYTKIRQWVLYPLHVVLTMAAVITA